MEMLKTGQFMEGKRRMKNITHIRITRQSAGRLDISVKSQDRYPAPYVLQIESPPLLGSLERECGHGQLMLPSA